jgi:aminoglycoside phosphotransferase (APT) family kinase protein
MICVMMSRILHHFSIPSTALLGKGSESQVYALDPTRVLRIYPPGASLATIQARQNFYMQLAARHPPFVIPTVLDQGVVDGHPYTIEQRMHGHDFAHILPQLTGDDRARALTSYLDLATQIGTIQFPVAPFGELILPGALQRDTWAHFLWDRAQQTLQISRRDVEHDVAQLDHLLSEFHTRLLPMLTIQTRSLVHGDYFPGNVFIDDTLQVYAVGDFGYSTVVGDPRMDIVGAIVFLEVVEGYQAADTELLLRSVQQSRVGVSTDIIELYRLYYSLYFSHCKHDDPKTYAWCIQNLRTYVDGLP